VENERLLWANCAALWGRLFVLSAPLGTRFPEFRQDAEAALVAAIRRTAYGASEPRDDLVARLSAFSVPDDGTPEWQYAVDLLGSILNALSGKDAATTLREGTRFYLGSTFSDLANRLAEAEGRPISQVEAEEALRDDDAWREANAFANTLRASGHAA
jgi:hypothetical protein